MCQIFEDLDDVLR